jgi:hypothetical protein
VADHLTPLKGGWKMLGNDNFGDCVPVTKAHFKRMISALLTGVEVYPNQDEVFADYRSQNPNFVPDPRNPVEDNGMVIQDFLDYLRKKGEILAFAKVDHTNPDEVGAAIATFGGLWVGINVQSANMTQFNREQWWDYVAGSHDEGGHSIFYGLYNTDMGKPEACITWGEIQYSTDAFWQHQVEEAWLVVWPENVREGAKQFLQGVDVRALQVAYKDLTGKTLVLLQPTPAPTPGAASFPGASGAVDLHIHQTAARAHLSVPDWLNKHFNTYFHLS